MFDNRPETLRAASHAGCLAYGRMAIVLVFVANVAAYYMGSSGAMFGMILACLSMGAAYIGQMMFNLSDADVAPGSTRYQQAFRRGQIAQLVSIASAVLAGLVALVTA